LKHLRGGAAGAERRLKNVTAAVPFNTVSFADNIVAKAGRQAAEVETPVRAVESSPCSRERASRAAECIEARGGTTVAATEEAVIPLVRETLGPRGLRDLVSLHLLRLSGRHLGSNFLLLLHLLQLDLLRLDLLLLRLDLLPLPVVRLGVGERGGDCAIQIRVAESHGR
jgi:hypothetical protein